MPLSGVDVQSLFWAPRVGVAYDLFGTGKTLVRGGFGVFNFHDAQGPYSQFIDLPYGVTTTNTANVPLSQVPTVDPSTQPGLTGAILATDNKQPLTKSYSLTFQQRLPWRMMVEAAYVGSTSDRLLNDGINNLNHVPFGAMLNDPNGDPNLYRPLTRYGDPPGDAAHALPELQRAADVAQPSGDALQLHDRVHVVKGARHPRRRAGLHDAAARGPSRFRVRRPWLRSPARRERRL